VSATVSEAPAASYGAGLSCCAPNPLCGFGYSASIPVAVRSSRPQRSGARTSIIAPEVSKLAMTRADKRKSVVTIVSAQSEELGKLLQRIGKP
jgi:hypothetical protein